MATAELRLSVPVDSARDAVGYALAEQGFTAQPTASGSLDVSRGSMGTTLVAGAFAGQDMHVRFDVHFSEIPEGTLASFEHSTLGGFFKGGAIGAAKVGDVVRDAAHRAGARLAEQGVLVGGVPASPSGAGDAQQPAATDSTWAPPVPPAPPGYPGAASAGDGGAAPADGAPVGGAHTVAPAYGSSPYGTVPAASDRTNGISILAIILGFVFPIGGIIAGAVALAQIKRTGEKGRGLAITGIVAGAVISVLTILAVIGLLIFSFTVGSKASSADPFDVPTFPQDGGVTVGPSEAAPGDEDTFTLPVGVCLDDVPSGFISSSNIVECGTAHTYEVFSSFLLTEGSFPGDDAIASAAETGCESAFPSFVGIPYDQSALNYQYVAPTEGTWADGDREISCLLFDPAVQETTGSLAGSAR
ncbi:DUF4190 domain-containing protein [Microbacterium testaceum]|uniref:Septum formation-related domain-containing protein n=1 Tax=Microbacterium testaceum TaxID=2033 RepID=A0A4Y3QQ95_MICTE|nr:DUF4190 domain-containing protein [Microbacterium testaceum]MDZ5144901.1 DUF4190 domain-containing protein [Microbacterium testaceum]WJS91112.1 DUF4190 domain-containing protein [Microbacterium testaceum]GEB47361.1 hypothetical protein MTE01_33060 [Microbacterium testaceum]